jgi:undecaprenyl-diphosphatase
MMDVGLCLILSFAAAYIAIVAMLRLLERVSFTPFVIYRVVLGLVLFAIVYG